MVIHNPLADFVAGMDARTARCLAAVERACDAGMHAVSASDWLREFCTWYRIAAVHERDRVARAVHAVKATSPRVRLLDAAITVLAYDATRCEQFPHIGSEVYDLRQYMYFEPKMGFPYAYDTYMRFVPVRLPMLRPYRGVKGGIAALEREFAGKPVVRTTQVFSALFHAVAEETMRRDTDAVFGHGRDLAADMALIGYLNRGGDFTCDPEPGLWFDDVADALHTLAARVLGSNTGTVDVADPKLELTPRALFDDWAPVVLDRAGEVFAAYTAAGLD